MKNILFILIGITILNSCSKDSVELPMGNDFKKLLSIEYTLSSAEGNIDIAEGIDLIGESGLIQGYSNCELSSVVYHRNSFYTDADWYENGLGFRVILGTEYCPGEITKVITDELFPKGKLYTIGNEPGQIEISINRHNSATQWQRASGKSLQEDNTYHNFTIVSTEEYSWDERGVLRLGKLIHVEFSCELRQTNHVSFVYPAKSISISNGKGTFYVEYTD